MPETIRGGRFAILGTLGEGAQGRTFDGADLREGRPVAIKRFDVRGASSWKDVELAEREARVLQSLSHPRLPRYVDHFEENGALYLVMEKIDGESLASLRKRGASLGEADVVRLLRDAAEVLEYLHGRPQPVIHRDLKPGNVIRRPDGSFAFVDFGAVRDKLRPEGGSTVVGTFGFMAPEQFQGRALPASDVYAVGATAVAMLSGRDPEQLPHAGLAIDVRAALGGRVSERLTSVLAKMLDPDPDRRARSITPLLAQLGPDRGRTARPRARGADPWPAEWAHWRDAAHSFRDALEQDISRHARRQARRQARRHAKLAAREARRRSRRQRLMPWPFSLLLAIVFSMSIVLVSMATQVIGPLVLLVLSIAFGRGLREAAETVRQAGKTAIEGLNTSRRWLRGDLQDPQGAHDEGARARVESSEPPPGRVRVDPAEGETDDDDDEAWGEDRRRTGR
jgi:hypothetical protein